MLKKLSTIGMAAAVGISAVLPVASVMATDGCEAGYEMGEDGVCQELPARSELMPPYIANAPTELTITKIDTETNIINIRLTPDSGLTSGRPNTYLYMNVLRVSSNENGMMTDDMLSGSWFGGQYAGRRVSKIDVPYAEREEVYQAGGEYEFASLANITELTPEWYYWAVFETASHDRYYSVRGRIDFSDCMNSSAFVEGMSCQAQMGADGLYHYHLFDGDTEIEIPELAGVEEPEPGEPEPVEPEPVEPESVEPEPTEPEPVEPEPVGSEEPGESEESGEGNKNNVVIKEVIKEVPVEKVVEKEVVKEVTKEVPVERTVVKEAVKEVPVERIVVKYIENGVAAVSNDVTESENLTSSGTAEEDKNGSEDVLKALDEISVELNSLKTENKAEVPSLGTTETKQGWGYWWVVALVLGFSAGFVLMAVLKQARDER